MKAAGGLIAVVFAASLLSCLGSPTEPRGHELLAIETVLISQRSGIGTRRAELITDSGRWNAVWSEIHRDSSGLPPIPSVDFGSEMLILAALGQEPDSCWSIQIRSVRATGERLLEVLVVEGRSPPSCACATVIVNPVHVVRLRRSDRRPSFLFDQRVLGKTCE